MSYTAVFAPETHQESAIRSYRTAHGLPAPIYVQYLLLYNVPVPVPHFVALEVRGIDTLSFFRLLADFRHGSFITVVRMVAVVYVAMKVVWPVKPWAYADENASVKPFRAVIASRGTGVRGNVIVTVRAIGGHSHLDADLSGGCRGSGRYANPENRREQCNCKYAHGIHLAIPRASRLLLLRSVRLKLPPAQYVKIVLRQQ